MKHINIPNTPHETSKFIFGTDKIHHIKRSGSRSRLLSSAVDHGFTHFDTAPYYGFGNAEHDLKSILKYNPNVTVTTKVGLHPPGGANQSYFEMYCRKVLGKGVKSLSRVIIDFSLKMAEKSLHGSLKRLGRNNIEFYCLHEPRIELINTEEWQCWLEKIVSDGKIQTFGVAGTKDILQPFLKNSSQLTNFIQMQDGLVHKEADVLSEFNKPIQITYGYVSESLRLDPTSSISEVLKKALQRNKEGAIIVSTSRVDRLKQYAQILEDMQYD